jgi:hypothetical protein
MWREDANRNDAIANLAGEINKLGSTKGSWQADYAAVCTQFSILPCPYITARVIPERGTVISIANAVVDIANWRALLLSINVSGANILEIACHNSELKAQHFTDLLVGVDGILDFTTFKLEYSSISEESGAVVTDSLHKLLGANIQYISLRGCKFGNDVLAPALVALTTNVTIQSINLSDNNLSYPFGAELVKALRLNPFISTVSLAHNSFSDQSLMEILCLSFGMEASSAPAEDAALLKKLNAAVAEKNKNIKNVNKKRKKAGESELTEVPNIPDRQVQVVEGRSVAINRTLRALDFSWNEGMTLECFLAVLEPIVRKATALHSAAHCSGPLVVLMKGLVKDVPSRERLMRQSNEAISLVM